MSLFPSIFASLPFSLCIGEEYVMLRVFPLSGGLFLPCGHGLDFGISLERFMWKQNLVQKKIS